MAHYTRNIIVLLAVIFSALLISPECRGEAYDNVVFIDTDIGTGTAFVVDEGGTKYVYSNLHIIWAARQLTLRTIDGKQLAPIKLLVEKTRDLIKVELAPDNNAPKGFILSTNSPRIGESITVYGNSQGGNVITMLRGRIIAIGPGEIELDAKFVQGNSGSPIVYSNGDVCGVATYATRDIAPDWVAADTRFAKTRRFGIRLDQHMEWKAASMRDIYQQTSFISSMYISSFLINNVIMAPYIWGPGADADRLEIAIDAYQKSKSSYIFYDKAKLVADYANTLITLNTKTSKSSFSVRQAQRNFMDAFEAWIAHGVEDLKPDKWTSRFIYDEYSTARKTLNAPSLNLVTNVVNMMKSDGTCYQRFRDIK